MLSANDPSTLEMYTKIAFQNSTSNHEAIPQFVVFIFRDQFELYARHVRYMGNRHVVRSQGESPFRAIYFRTGNTNLFTPYLAKWLRHLSESGLTKMWINLNQLPYILRMKNTLMARGKWFKAMQDLFGKMREPVTFHEESVVSLDLIWPAFSISAVLIAFGGGVFAAENLNKLTQWGMIVVRFMKELASRMCTSIKAWIMIIIRVGKIPCKK